MNIRPLSGKRGRQNYHAWFNYGKDESKHTRNSIMWQVIKERYIGEEYIPEESKGFETNGRHIAKFSCKKNVTPQDPEDVSFAYEARIYPKLTLLLESPVLVLRQRAVSGLIELFKLKEENCISSINTGSIPHLLHLATDNDDFSRENSLDALTYISSVKQGRDTLIKEPKTISILKRRVEEDHSEKVQENALRVLKNIGREEHGCKVLGDNVVSLVLLKAKQGSNQAIKTEALRVLQRALYSKGVDEESLKYQSVSILTNILSSYNEEKVKADLLSVTCDVLALICFNHPGRDEAVKEESVYSLIPLFGHQDETVRQSSINCLAQITVAKLAKDQCISSISDLTPVKNLLQAPSESKQTKVNILRFITNLSEHPLARRFFMDQLPFLQTARKELESELSFDSSASIQSLNFQYLNCLTVCINKVAWKP